MGISPKINKRGGSNNRVDGIFHQKLINVEVLIRHVVGNFFSKRIRKTPCLLETSEYVTKIDIKVLPLHGPGIRLLLKRNMK